MKAVVLFFTYTYAFFIILKLEANKALTRFFLVQTMFAEGGEQWGMWAIN